MNIEMGSPSKPPGNASRSQHDAEPQLSLALEADSRNEYALRAAWARSGLKMPFHVAMRSRPIATCLRGLAEAMRRKACLNDHATDKQHRPEPQHETANSSARESAVAESYG